MATEHNVVFIPCFQEEMIAPLFHHLLSLERYGKLPKHEMSRIQPSSVRSVDGRFTAHGAEELGAPTWHYPVSVLVYTTTKIMGLLLQHPVMFGKVPTWWVTHDGGTTTQYDAFLDVFDLPYADTFTRVVFPAVNCVWLRPVATLWPLCLPDTVTAMEVGRESFSPSLFLCPASPALADLFCTAKTSVTHPAYAHAAFVTECLRRRCVGLGQLSKLVLYNLPRPSHLHPYTVWTVVCDM